MSLISSFAWNSSVTSSLERKSTEIFAFLRFLHWWGILRFPPPTSGRSANFGTYVMSLISLVAWNSSLTSSLERKSTENVAFLRFLHLRGILRFFDPPTSGPSANLGTYDSFLRFLRLREILRLFVLWGGKAHFRRIWEHTSQNGRICITGGGGESPQFSLFSFNIE